METKRGKIVILTDQDLSCAKKLWEKWNHKHKNESVLSERYTCKTVMFEELKNILLESLRISVINKFSASLDMYRVELYHYKVGLKDIMVSAPFEWHCDDMGPLSTKVVTVLFYLQKDKTIKAGNLEYNLEKRETIFIEENMIVIMDGDVQHNVSPMRGEGERRLIAVFMKYKF